MYMVSTNLDSKTTRVTDMKTGFSVDVRGAQGHMSSEALKGVMGGMNSSIAGSGGRIRNLGSLNEAIRTLSGVAGGASITAIGANIGGTHLEISGGVARWTDLNTGRTISDNVADPVSTVRDMARAEQQRERQMDSNALGNVVPGQTAIVEVRRGLTCAVAMDMSGRMTATVSDASGDRAMSVQGASLLGALDQALGATGYGADFASVKAVADRDFNGRLPVESGSAARLDATTGMSPEAGMRFDYDASGNMVGVGNFSNTSVELLGDEVRTMSRKHDHTDPMSLSADKGFSSMEADIATEIARAAAHGLDSTDDLAPMEIRQRSAVDGSIIDSVWLVSRKGGKEWNVERRDEDTGMVAEELHTFTENDINRIKSGMKLEMSSLGTRVEMTLTLDDGQKLLLSSVPVRQEGAKEISIKTTTMRGAVGVSDVGDRQAAAPSVRGSYGDSLSEAREERELDARPPTVVAGEARGEPAGTTMDADAAGSMDKVIRATGTVGALSLARKAQSTMSEAIDSAAEWIADAVDVKLSRRGESVVTIDMRKMPKGLDSRQRERLANLMSVKGLGDLARISDADVDNIIGGLRAAEILAEGIGSQIFTVQDGNQIGVVDGKLRIIFKDADTRSHFVDGELVLTSGLSKVLRQGTVDEISSVLPKILFETGRFEGTTKKWRMSGATAAIFKDAVQRVAAEGKDVEVSAEAVMLGADVGAVAEAMGVSAGDVKAAVAGLRGEDAGAAGVVALSEKQKAGLTALARQATTRTTTPITTHEIGAGAGLSTGTLAPGTAAEQLIAKASTEVVDTAAKEKADTKDGEVIGVREAVSGTGFSLTIPVAGGKTEQVNVSRKDMIELAKAVGSSLDKILKEDMGLNKASYVYLVDLNVVAGSESFDRAVDTFAKINATLGMAQFHVVAVGEGTAGSTDIEGMLDRYAGTLEYSDLGDVDAKLSAIETAVAASGEAGEIHKTGIAGEKASSGIRSTFERVCDVFVKAESFGEAIVLAIAASNLKVEYTDAAEEKLAAWMKKARADRKDGNAAVISVGGTRSENAEEEIDNYIFGGRYADTQF